MRKGKLFKKAVAAALSIALVVTGVSTGGGKSAVSAEDTKELTSTEVEKLYKQYFKSKAYDRVSVHDPSVVVGYIDGAAYTGKEQVYGEQNAKKTRKEVYFIFGSHVAFAYSTDLKNWKYFENNLNKKGSTAYKTVFKEGFAWSDNGDPVYNPSGNMWAPDVIWNPYYVNDDKTKGAWLMYMSINGCSWNSSIALLTAKSLNGDWTYQGTVVYSGFTASGVYSYQGTDYAEVTGDTSLPSRYTRSAYTCKDNGTSCTATTWNERYGAHAIDPCITFDGKDMWMSYGSWSGGLWMFKIDPATGLRDKSVTYPYTANVSDPYMGYQIAGGSGVSGEASYIEKIGGKYYLFVSYGGLTAAGGYNIRVFAANSITGPYKDLQGHDARQGYTSKAGDINGNVGNRLMTYYKWNFMNSGFVAEGHNSAFVDDDGKAYVVYHTRFDNRGEVHEVRVHQLFAAKNGGLVTAPFEYSGETLSKTPYKNDEIVGEYNVVRMKSTDFTKLECATEETIQLKADGTVTGAYSGTWSQGTDGPYLTLTAGGVTYKGVFVEQNMEETGCKVMCLTLVGSNDISIWGYKSGFSDADAVVVYNAYNIKTEIPTSVFAGSTLELSTEGYFGAVYSWKSLDTNIISNDGKVKNVTADTNATLRLTISKDNYKYSKDISIKVLSDSSKNSLLPLKSNAILEEYGNKEAFNAALPNKKITASTGLSFSMYAPKMENDWVTVLQNKTKTTLLQFATISYSEKNDWCWYYEAAATVSDYAKKQGYDAGSIWTAFVDSTKGAYYLTISFNTDGSISYYRDGNLMMTYGANTKPSNGAINTTISKISNKVISDYLAGNMEMPYDVSNVVVGYATDFKVDDYVPVTYDKYAYYADYDNVGVSADWESTNGEVTGNSDTERGNFAQLNVTGSGNRGAVLDFDSKVTGLADYTIEVDTALTAGMQDNRSESEFMITSTSSSVKSNTNTRSGGSDDSDYIVRLTTPTYLAADESTRTTWYVNGDITKKVTIPVGTWVNIKAQVKTGTKTAELTITNSKTGTTLYEGTVNIKGDSANLKGLYTMMGRNGGSTAVDKIKVYEGTTDPYAGGNSDDTPSATEEPQPVETPTPEPTETPEPDDEEPSEDVPADKGTVLKDTKNKCTVKVVSDDEIAPKVTYVKPTVKKADIVIPNAVTIDAISYRVTAVSDNAFANDTKVTKITVGKNVTSIGKNAFKNCKKLNKIIIKGTALKKVGGSAFKGVSAKAVIQVPKAKKTSYKKMLKKAGFKGTVK